MQIHHCHLEVQLARFDLREVENVVDDHHQGFAGISHDLKVILLFLRRDSGNQ